MVILKSIRHRGVSYLLTALVAMAAVVCQILLRPWAGDKLPFLFFLPTVLFVASALGRGHALCVLSVGAVNWFFVSSAAGHVGHERDQDVIVVLAYLSVGLMLIASGGRLRLSTERATVAEEHLALAQENTGIGVFELDFESDTAYVSSSLSGLLGQPVMDGAIPLDGWLDRLHPGHVEESRAAIKAHLEAGELSYEREHRIELPNGGSRWLLTRVRLDVGARGELIRARGATIDISARKQSDEQLLLAQAELQQQLEDLERIRTLNQELISADAKLVPSLGSAISLLCSFHGASDGIVAFFDATDARPVVAVSCRSGEVCAAGAPEREALVLEASAEMLNAIVLAPHNLFVPDVAADARLFATGHLAESSNMRSVHITPMLTVAGKLLGALAVFGSTSEPPTSRQVRLGEICAIAVSAFVAREQARVIAAQKDQRFAVALQSSTVPFTIVSPVRAQGGAIVDFRFSYLNPAAAAALGSPLSALLGQKVGEVLPLRWERPGLFDRLKLVAESRIPTEFELRSASNRGVRWHYVVASALDASLAIWFADITDRKAQEQSLHAADRRKDEFLATLAHELRSPLAPIRQAVVVAHSPLTDEARRRWSLEIIERQVERMALLLDDLLDVSRITRGNLQLRHSHTTLAALVDAALETSSPYLEEKHQTLSLRVPEEPVSLYLDGLRISQVLANLLTNAAKYSDDGSLITLEASIEGDGLHFRVTDRGIGFSPEQADQVFEMFSQTPQALHRSQGGLGIGLALSKEIVRLHGGRIEAHSEGQGLGSTFTIALPSVRRVQAGARLESRPLGMTSGSTEARGLRVLVADDNADAAESLAELLRMCGHEVHIAFDGEEALAAFCRCGPDLALLDVGMPRMSGLEVARAIRQMPSGTDATLVAITGWGQERDRRDAIEAGFDHHATKPIALSRLEELIGARSAGNVNPAH